MTHRCQVKPWEDPVVEACGHHPLGPASDEAWCAVVGPSGMALHRALHRRIGSDVSVDELAALLALVPSRLSRTLDRVERFGLVRRGGDTVEVRVALPPLTLRQRRKLPAAHPLHLEAS